jgi:3' terminal RNA ribose 2'-O-methyltransferase Hen1
MLLTITTTYSPATDLGYLLHKHPQRLQTFSQTFGKAYVFYPEANETRCTAALLLDVDTIHLVRGRNKGMSLDQYVNDRPYVASSFLSVAMSDVFRTAMNGRCEARPTLVNENIPLQAHLAVVPCRGGEAFLRSLFEPLGYTVTLKRRMLDETRPEWGMSDYFSVTLSANCRLRDLLTHLYVLIPVLDDDKHYWVGDEEVEKLLKNGQGWLESHPQQQQIAHRYLKHKHNLTRDALARLVVEERQVEEKADGQEDAAKEKNERRVSLHEQRLRAVLSALQSSRAKRVLDLGCGEGKLLKLLLQDKNFEHILGMDVSYRVLELAKERLHLERLPERVRERITLLHGALTYRDKRLAGYDAAAVVEVIEHLDTARLAAFERTLFEFAQPRTVVITTPNAEYNVKYETLAAGEMRHKDHRFEWTRPEFQQWATAVADRFGYSLQCSPIGEEDTLVGAPSQMAVFTRNA